MKCDNCTKACRRSAVSRPSWSDWGFRRDQTEPRFIYGDLGHVPISSSVLITMEKHQQGGCHGYVVAGAILQRLRGASEQFGGPFHAHTLTSDVGESKKTLSFSVIWILCFSGLMFLPEKKLLSDGGP